MSSPTSYNKIRPMPETQTIFHGYGATGGASDLSMADNSFYQIPSSQWGSNPAPNSYGFNLTMISRLYGSIRSVSLSMNFSTPATEEPVSVEIHIRNKNFPAVTTGIRVIKIGVVKMSDPIIPQPSLILCDVPISRGDSYNLVLRAPSWVTNPLQTMFTGIVVIEGVSSRQNPEIAFGMKNYDMAFNSATNTSPADNTSYYFLQLNTPLSTTNSNLWWQASPYNGYIEETTLHVLNSSGIQGTSEKVELRVQIKQGDKLKGDYHLRYYSLDMASGTGRCEITKCKIPINRGDCANVYFKSPVFATNPTLIRTLCYLHLRGN